MLVEITLLQKFILFLGQPAFAMAAVLFAMLLFSGLGSLWSSRLEARRRTAKLAILGILLLLVLHFLLLPPIIHAMLGSQIWVRFCTSVGLLAPLAFLMGIPFPTGLRILGQRGSQVIPLAYSANGCASVGDPR
jgi:hypothetical protein